MGETAPAHMDGRVLTEVLHPDFQPARRAAPTSATLMPTDALAGQGGLSPEEQKVLAERLRSLGYVG